MGSKSLRLLAKRLGESCCQTKTTIATAESCTGGQLATLITSIPGSSGWFECGFISYSNKAKQRQLNVAAHTLDQYGAVSKQVAIAMACGLLKVTQAELGVSITGVAGPAGGTKPIGTVYIAWHERRSGHIHTMQMQYTGSRLIVRKKACETALQGLIAVAEGCYEKWYKKARDSNDKR